MSEPPSLLTQLADRGIHSRLGPVRKATRLLLAVLRAALRLADTSEARQAAPPVLANAFPKSGTHLLEQIVGALPRRRNFGSFLESMTASYVFRERSLESTIGFLDRLVAGEVVRAHLHHHPRLAEELHRRPLVHYLIYRDLRDVLVSETHYLRCRNPWHRLHPFFRDRISFDEALLLAIRGLDREESELVYPDVGKRFERFLPWLARPEVCAVRYEDLQSEERPAVLARMVRHYASRAALPRAADEVIAAAAAAIAPQRSHTFRRGTSGEWRRTFSNRHRAAFDEVAGELMLRLGYAP